MPAGQRVIVWFRNDLRIADNPALTAAIATGLPVVGVYLHEGRSGPRPIGSAARWWLHESLLALGRDLASLGIRLQVETGSAGTVLPQLVEQEGAGAVLWNRRYAPAARDVDAAIKEDLRNHGIEAVSFPGSVLVEPFDIATGEGRPYSVFTPFWRALRQRDIARPASRPPAVGPALQPETSPDRYDLPRWAAKLPPHWQVGEAAAIKTLHDFLEQTVARYPDGRDLPGRELTSKLSPHLRFGEISPRQVWHAALAHGAHTPDGEAVEKFLSELAWRDFSYHLLFHRPDIATVSMQSRFDAIAWRTDQAALTAWQRGETGIPIVDAGMRQLWETGWMHNRVRMLAASLLAKNLLIDWREGEQWFWDTLVDADEASNPASWQWVAGCGADAAPYFRIFNPITQGEKFDPEGNYVRRWVPELSPVPDKWLHRPSEAPREVLEAAGVRLGKTYPRQLVDLAVTRRQALEALAQG